MLGSFYSDCFAVDNSSPTSEETRLLNIALPHLVFLLFFNHIRDLSEISGGGGEGWSFQLGNENKIP